jgi:hypothetical protein
MPLTRGSTSKWPKKVMKNRDNVSNLWWFLNEQHILFKIVMLFVVFIIFLILSIYIVGGYKIYLFNQLFAIESPQKMSVKGIVKLKGEPTEGIEVRVKYNNQIKEEIKTDSKGVYIFPNLDPKKIYAVQIDSKYGEVNVLVENDRANKFGVVDLGPIDGTKNVALGKPVVYLFPVDSKSPKAVPGFLRGYQPIDPFSHNSQSGPFGHLSQPGPFGHYSQPGPFGHLSQPGPFGHYSQKYSIDEYDDEIDKLFNTDKEIFKGLGLNWYEIYSIANNFYPSNLTDGIIETEFNSGTWKFDVILDLRSDYLIHDIHLIWGNYGLAKTSIISQWNLSYAKSITQPSQSKSEYPIFYMGLVKWEIATNGGYPNSKETYVKGPFKARYLKIEAKSLPSSKIGMNEVLVYGELLQKKDN